MIKELRNVRILRRFGINGMVIYPFVLYASGDPDSRVRRHEMIHVEQIKRVGVKNFYLQYLREYFKLRLKGFGHDAAYRGISFEQEAYLREAETGPLLS